MSEDEIRAMHLTPNRIINITLGTLVTSMIGLFVALFSGYFWLDGKFDNLDRRILTMEIRASKGVTMSTGNQTVSIGPEESEEETEVERILGSDPPTLSVQELAILEGVATRTVLSHIALQPDGVHVWTDRYSRQWTAQKEGRAWRIVNPFRIARNNTE